MVDGGDWRGKRKRTSRRRGAVFVGRGKFHGKKQEVRRRAARCMRVGREVHLLSRYSTQQDGRWAKTGSTETGSNTRGNEAWQADSPRVELALSVCLVSHASHQREDEPQEGS